MGKLSKVMQDTVLSWEVMRYADRDAIEPASHWGDKISRYCQSVLKEVAMNKHVSTNQIISLCFFTQRLIVG